MEQLQRRQQIGPTLENVYRFNLKLKLRYVLKLVKVIGHKVQAMVPLQLKQPTLLILVYVLQYMIMPKQQLILLLDQIIRDKQPRLKAHLNLQQLLLIE
jgi:hypothetical protein